MAVEPKHRPNVKHILCKKRLKEIIDDKQNRSIDEFLKSIAHSIQLYIYKLF